MGDVIDQLWRDVRREGGELAKDVEQLVKDRFGGAQVDVRVGQDNRASFQLGEKRVLSFATLAGAALLGVAVGVALKS